MSRRSLDNQKSLCPVAVIPFAASPIPIFQCAEIEAATYKSPLPPKKMAKLQIAPAEAGAMASPAKANALTVEASRKFLAQEKLPRAMIGMSDESEEYSIILCEIEHYSIPLL
jgi:hypothetical protein